jgi:formate hydrogenlyase subunit 3/multisubunit Na+/H+ antiporter MnhD subunit
MYLTLVRIGSFLVGLSIVLFYVSGTTLNFIQLRKEKELRKLNKYE